MANLYEINEALMKAWESAVDPETGEINEEAYKNVEALEIERSEKIENIACWVKNLESDAVGLKAEAKALTDRAKYALNKAESLREYLGYALGGQKFSTNRVAISYRKSQAVECSLEDITVLNDEYLRWKDPELNKDAIKKALKDGIDIEGCKLVDNVSMQIK